METLKNRFIICLAIAVGVGLISCSIEKRHYRDGFYVDWKHNSGKTHESVGLIETGAASELTFPITESVDTNSAAADVKKQEVFFPVAHHDVQPVNSEKTKTETPNDVDVNLEKTRTPAPLETDKKQAVGAGIAAAVFFVLGMVGLIIKGTAPPTGIFIGAAFLCCVLCIVLASFLYPRDPVVKQPKEETVVPDKGIMAAGLGLLILVLSVFLLGVALFFSIFTDIFI